MDCSSQARHVLPQMRESPASNMGHRGIGFGMNFIQNNVERKSLDESLTAASTETSVCT